MKSTPAWVAVVVLLPALVNGARNGERSPFRNINLLSILPPVDSSTLNIKLLIHGEERRRSCPSEQFLPLVARG